MVIVKTISKFYKLIENIKLDENLENWQNDIFENIINKLTVFTKNKLLENQFITIYVKNLKECEQDLYLSNIKEFKDPMYVYLLKLLIKSKKEFLTSENKVKLLLVEYDKEKIEIENVVNSLIHLICFTDTKQSLSINTKKIDSLYSNNVTKFAKNANKSIVKTLTGKRKNDKFIIFPSCKKNIVSIDKISKPYLDIGEKNINIPCPVCGEIFNIDKSNIMKIFSVQQNNIILFNCKHFKSSTHAGSLPFKMDLNKYFTNINNKDNKDNKEIKFENIQKIMFLINNLKHFRGASE